MEVAGALRGRSVPRRVPAPSESVERGRLVARAGRHGTSSGPRRKKAKVLRSGPPSTATMTVYYHDSHAKVDSDISASACSYAFPFVRFELHVSVRDTAHTTLVPRRSLVDRDQITKTPKRKAHRPHASASVDGCVMLVAGCHRAWACGLATFSISRSITRSPYLVSSRRESRRTCAAR